MNEHEEDKDVERLVSTLVNVEWPLHDGHTFAFCASRRLTESEYETLVRLLQLAKPGLIESPTEPA